MGNAKRALMIINPTARSLPSPDRLATAPAWLRLHGWEVVERRTEGAGHATVLAREAVVAGIDAVVAVGGDGTVNEAANGLTGSPAPLAVIPAGTANVWAREVRLPTHPAACARLLDEGAVRRLDLGVVNDRHFLLMASLGVDSVVVAAISPWAKRRFGRLAYITSGVREAITFPPLRARIRLDGRLMPEELLLLVVGNTRSYGGLITITNRAVADDGLLDLVVYRGAGFGRFVGYLARTAIGRHVTAPGTHYQHARTIDVETDDPLPVQADGELVGSTPARFRVAPGALRVIVPAGLSSHLFQHPPEAGPRPHLPAAGG
ncbi:MAG: diacylglycerol kinase family protein [Dehalococcoidia bacterium]